MDATGGPVEQADLKLLRKKIFKRHPALCIPHTIENKVVGVFDLSTHDGELPIWFLPGRLAEQRILICLLKAQVNKMYKNKPKS